MDTIDLDIEKLCSSSFMFDEKIRRVMLDWERTNSPLWTYWGNLMRDDFEFGERYVIPSDREMTECNVMSNDHSRINTSDCHQRGTFFYHLPQDEVNSVCKSRYKNDVVKLTLQIAHPTVVKIEKDVSTSFAEIIGVVGMYGNKSVKGHATCLTCARNVSVTGGTLGLFTGLSLISIVEAVYWMLKVKPIQCPLTGNNRNK